MYDADNLAIYKCIKSTCSIASFHNVICLLHFNKAGNKIRVSFCAWWDLQYKQISHPHCLGRNKILKIQMGSYMQNTWKQVKANPQILLCQHKPSLRLLLHYKGMQLLFRAHSRHLFVLRGNCTELYIAWSYI